LLSTNATLKSGIPSPNAAERDPQQTRLFRLGPAMLEINQSNLGGKVPKIVT
jgi:hypothetical protein